MSQRLVGCGGSGRRRQRPVAVVGVLTSGTWRSVCARTYVSSDVRSVRRAPQTDCAPASRSSFRQGAGHHLHSPLHQRTFGRSPGPAGASKAVSHALMLCATWFYHFMLCPTLPGGRSGVRTSQVQPAARMLTVSMPWRAFRGSDIWGSVCHIQPPVFVSMPWRAFRGSDLLW